MWLALETSGDRASVAVGEPGRVLAEESLVGARRHAGALLPMVHRALAAAGAGLDAIAAVAVADGPGSFTGLRVGASVGKALAHAHGLPLWAAPSLMVLAAGAAIDDGVPIAALTDALRGDVYLGVYAFADGAVETIVPASVRRPAEAVGLIPARARVVAPVPPVVLDALEAAGLRVEGTTPTDGPRASALLRLAGQRGGAARVESPDLWEPAYGRPAEAQVRWEQAHGRALPHSSGARE
ncbi:MAG TPA: tRNA (adenosine(37)-N6)-threonylcarbamoyltransferase complex dimerization subunit type 1 TsaB [Gemmatimonadales bacterium]|nr:tRNA (adenosine(37)-N6)-threonylcarbamoyltransferase complex dimerization subunit type 1 TsaB [Gemmatimonadales bacterium]